ncbi:MAG: hypothetical protein FJ098_02205 [Deltaproteobacteria bacterium]|nr:hypothetical protein [Deltaproteobacteria bacterium]
MRRMALVSSLLFVLTTCSTGGGAGGGDAAPDAAALTDTARPADLPADRGGAADLDSAGPGLPPGYLEFCITDADCADFGLQCFSLGPTDPTPLCSSPCASSADCPESMMCKAKGEETICQLAAYCDACTADAECGGATSACLEDKEGGRFCSSKCTLDDLETCAPGHYCKRIGSGLEDYYCFPLFGACRGDGSHCTPCQGDPDCQKGLVCHVNETTAESYCATVCQTDQECAKGFGCHELGGEAFHLCTLEIEGEPVETCYMGNKLFCEPCMADHECETGICYQYAVENNYHCSFACDEALWPGSLKGCPPGLFCVPNHGPSVASKVCATPGAWGCQGFLNCLGVECAKGEKCVDGFCQPK